MKPAPARFAIGAVLLSSAGILAGCASMHGIAPDATPASAAALQPDAQMRQEAAAAWPQQRWWQAFGDPQLDRLIEIAGAGNPDLTVARARVRLAAAQASAAHAGTLPGIDAKASAQDTLFTRQSFIPPPYAGNFWWSNDAALDFHYALDLWGGDAAALESAKANTLASAAAEQAARLSLQSTIVQAYAQLALQYERRDVLGADLQNRQQLVDIARQRLAAGIGTELELAQAQTGVPVAQAEIDAVDQQIEILHHQLAALSGQGPDAGDALTPPHLQLPQGSLLPSQLPAELIARRPDIAARRWQLEAAAQTIKVARARFYPNIDLVAAVGLQSLGFHHFLTDDALAANVGPAISLPIFDGGKLRANLDARSAQYDEAVGAYNATLIQALQQIADQVTTIRGLERQQVQIDAAVTSAQHAHDLAMRGYRAGLTDYLNVLNAETGLLAQRDRAASLRLHRLAAHAQLIAAIGGGLPPATDDATP
ncbi:efflux transporter outer membrane subunit [Solimonas terrae]|uniref:Efflux transporter outer membrane subunit n=1 Tax=Solimonas terrae TaxID=1396819 RepID=A0A6M2BV49_9GAMM|nr:efflux transporter outer membrane subunit [Solimonas terrae]NGY05879.1 efflux transporter outer membrane subunit [Solimonas terrae]